MGADSHHDPKYLVKKLVPLDTEPHADGRRCERIGDRWFRVEDLPEGEPVFYRDVSQAFENANRFANLTWTHHLVLASALPASKSRCRPRRRYRTIAEQMGGNGRGSTRGSTSETTNKMEITGVITNRCTA